MTDDKMMIDQCLLDNLLEQAGENVRRRMNFDLRTSGEDSSQRMLNALLPGTDVPIHRHKDTAETVFVISGRVTEVLFDEKGEERARYELNPAEGRYGMQIPKGVWHTVIVDEPCVIFEAKDGAFAPRAAEDVWDSK